MLRLYPKVAKPSKHGRGSAHCGARAGISGARFWQLSAVSHQPGISHRLAAAGGVRHLAQPRNGGSAGAGIHHSSGPHQSRVTQMTFNGSPSHSTDRPTAVRTATISLPRA